MRTRAPKPVKQAPAPVTTPSRSAGAGEDWANINATQAAGQPERNQKALHTLRSELSQETNPDNISALEREIGRSEKLEGNRKDYGKRQDGTRKGKGWLGEYKRADGSISTEISVGVNIDGKEREIPTMVPGLTHQELKYLVEGGRPTDAIVDKAVAHARKRIKSGKSPFAD